MPKKLKVVFSKKLATRLVMNGFECLETQINYKHPNLLVFLFEDTPELREYIDSYKIERSR